MDSDGPSSKAESLRKSVAALCEALKVAAPKASEASSIEVSLTAAARAVSEVGFLRLSSRA